MEMNTITGHCNKHDQILIDEKKCVFCNPEPSKDHKDAMIFYAFRYCLGRMTYAVIDCVEYIIWAWDDLSDKTKDRIKKEINEALESGDAGMDIDRNKWKKILQLKD